MRSLTFDDLFAMLSAVALSADDLARLREWLAGIAHPGECIALIEQAAAGRISDGAVAYRHFAAQAGITHEAVNVEARGRARGAIHIQNVNSWHSRFRNWLVRFRGVASRYLINYSGWLRMLDARRLTTPALLLNAAVQLG